MKFQQQPHTLLMIRPKAFGFNEQTESSNAFQQKIKADYALTEFDRMVTLLDSHEVSVMVLDDTNDPIKPDAVFPNNWISMHENGLLILYPMMAENRRPERRNDVVDEIKKRFEVTTILDLSSEEINGNFLEGTGSIVFDHPHKIAYACRSPRTNETLIRFVCSKLSYTPIVFDAFDSNQKPIYHTNVLMAVADKFALLCLDAIRDDDDQEKLLDSFVRTGKKVIAISLAQMSAFAGNALEVTSRSGERYLLISKTALDALLPGQINAITQYVELLPVPIPTIEKVGGGSVRCMVAGIYLPFRKLQP
jgi:hypothetical protein